MCDKPPPHKRSEFADTVTSVLVVLLIYLRKALGLYLLVNTFWGGAYTWGDLYTAKILG